MQCQKNADDASEYADCPKSYEGAAKFVTGMYPSWVVSDLTVEKTNAWLNGAGKDAPTVLRKLVKESQDGLIRALKVQKLDK